MEFHPLADIFPMMGIDEFASLKVSIAEYGLREPITLAEGKIVDGRNRYNVCVELSIEPKYVKWDGVGSLLTFIIAINGNRRHMSESRRAMAADKLADLPHGGAMYATSDVENSTSLTQTDAANMLNVSRHSVMAARKVRTSGTFELVDIVERGKVTLEQRKDVAVSLAARVADWGKEKQAEFVRRVKLGIMPAVAFRQIAHEEKRVQPFPIGKYQVIYADPPWEYSNVGFDEAADAQYPTMAVEEICALSVGELATDMSVLFLWATNPLLPDAIKVIEAWGFEYKTNMVWVKDKARGKGWWLKSKHELLLIGVHGNTPHPAVRPSSAFEAERGAVHSRKPRVIYEVIESMYPEGKKVELFSRNKREGWEMWGNENGNA